MGLGFEWGMLDSKGRREVCVGVERWRKGIMDLRPQSILCALANNHV